MKKYILFVLLIAIISANNYSQNYIPETLTVTGNVNGNQTFTAYKSIYSDANITTGANESVNFVSNGTIYLQPGLHVKEGATFQASITNVGNLVNIDNAVVPSSVGLNQKLEAIINVSNFTKNPYKPSDIDLYAIITSPSLKQYRVNAFYYTNYDFNSSDCQILSGGDYGNSYYESKKINPLISDWRIRFAPKETGTWSMKIYCVLDGSIQLAYPVNLSFNCSSSTNPGFIKVSTNNKTLQFENGTPLFLIGENMENANNSDYTFSNKTIGAGCSSQWGEILNSNYKTGGICMFNKWIQELSDAGGNYIRLGHNDVIKKVNNEYVYNLEFAYRIDKYIEITANRNVNVKYNLIPHSVITDCNFFNTQSTDFINLKNYLRYIVARYGYATNILSWEILDEIFMVSPNGNNCSVSNPQSVVNWFSQVKSYIKSLDNNHLVSAGGLSWGNGWENTSSDYRNQIAKVMDLIEIHFGGQFSFVNNPNGKETAVQDLCSLPISGNPNDYDEGRRHFSDLNSIRTSMNKPVLMNSFWYPDNNSCRSDHFIDPYGFYIHNAVWLSLFSNSLGTSAPYYWSGNIHPGYYRKAGYFNLYYCIDKFTDKGLDFNPGQLNHFKQVKQFTQNIDYSVNWESVANFSSSEITATNSSIRIVALRNPSKNLYYGWLQDKRYQYKELIQNNCAYLKSLTEGKPQPIITGAKISVKVSESACYQIKWYRINHDDISVENVMSSFRASNGYVTFDIPQIAYNAIYGDMAFIIKKVTANDHYAEFKVNDIADTRIDICGSSPILLTAFETYCEESEHYYIHIQECDMYMNVFGRELEYLTYSLPRDFDIRAFCSQNNFSLLPGHYYKVKLSLSNPYNAIGKILYIKNQATPDFKIKDACGNWIQQYNNGYVVIDNTDGSPLWVDANITDCANKYQVIVQECDRYWNRYSFCKSWDRWYFGHPGIFDVQQLMRNTVEGFDLMGGHLDNGLDRYYKIQIATNEPDGNWTPQTILVRKEPINCSNSSTLKSLKTTSDPDGDLKSESKENVLIFPNPSNGKFRITFNVDPANKILLQVSNSLGETIYSENNILNNSIDIDLSKYSSGIYVVKLQIGTNLITRKIILYR